MSMPSKDIKTVGYVMRRTNYGEADRILDIITPLGKIAAIARGARREKSKLAGGIEMFTLTDYCLHKGQGELAIVTSAKMQNHFSNIMKSYDRIELGGAILKKVAKIAEGSDNEEYFNIVHQALTGLNDGVDVRLVETYALVNLASAMGEELNLQRDSKGERLAPQQRYDWDEPNDCFVERERGAFNENDIKLLRMIASTDLAVVTRVKNIDGSLGKAWELVRAVVHI